MRRLTGDSQYTHTHTHTTKGPEETRGNTTHRLMGRDGESIVGGGKDACF